MVHFLLLLLVVFSQVILFGFFFYKNFVWSNHWFKFDFDLNWWHVRPEGRQNGVIAKSGWLSNWCNSVLSVWFNRIFDAAFFDGNSSGRFTDAGARYVLGEFHQIDFFDSINSLVRLKVQFDWPRLPDELSSFDSARLSSSPNVKTQRNCSALKSMPTFSTIWNYVMSPAGHVSICLFE